MGFVLKRAQNARLLGTRPISPIRLCQETRPKQLPSDRHNSGASGKPNIFGEMKVFGRLAYGDPRAISLLSNSRPMLRCFSSYTSSFLEHESFIRDVAAAQPPRNLCHLLRMLEIKGESITSPGAKKGLMPLVIPLAKHTSDAMIALLRWPTAPPGRELPVVKVHKRGVQLLAKSVDQFIQRILVEEDVNSSSIGNDELFDAVSYTGDNLYTKGDFAKSQISDLDAFLLKKVGLFPDVLERKVLLHFQEGDLVSALVTGEFYARKEHFPGFARPFVFNAELLLKIGRKMEAKDAARGALKAPWWTLGCKYEDVARIAEWEDEQINCIRERVTQEGRQQELDKGKEPAQIAMDEAAFLLDLASLEGTWDDSLERIADCYKEAGLEDIGRFVEYRD